MLGKKDQKSGPARYGRIKSYRIMWLFATFDLPSVSKEDRKRYAQYRKKLLKDGFSMHQYSVYIRYCGSRQSAAVHIRRLKKWMPPKGHVSIIMITDKQYGRIINLWGRKSKKLPPQPKQLELF